jgi:hypothetical protein
VPLGGQAVAPQSFAKVYWNKETQVVYVDAVGYQNHQRDELYQVWALKLNPLTPTSIGLLDKFDKQQPTCLLSTIQVMQALNYS